MIQIKKINIIENGEKTRCICETYLDKEKRDIWFEVDKKYGPYLCDERADAYIIGLLSFAMRSGHDICSDIPVTESLLYQIQEVVIPELAKHSSNLKSITIKASTGAALQSGYGVATALSCGVDSFWSIQKHLFSKYEGHNLTHVCINNVGAFNECYGEYGADKVKEERYSIAEKVAEELGVELVATNSNFADVYKQNHLLTCSYSNVFAIYMLQKLWKIYYVCSNGIDFAEFSLKDNDTRSSEQSELFLLQYFSTPYLKLYCDGGELSRLEKTRDICDVDYVQKYLHVCVSKPYNCGICSKCRRTILTIDALEKLDDFKDSFDIDYYKQHKDEYYTWLFREHYFGSKMNDPVFNLIKSKADYKGDFVYFSKNVFGKLKHIFVK